MKIPAQNLHAGDVHYNNCQACCCRLEVLLLTDTGVPERYTESDEWGASRMRRLDDGWCAALDRNSMLCTIYDKRPLICREFAMGSDECRDERAAFVAGDTG